MSTTASLIDDLLHPATDAGVAAQVMGVVVVTTIVTTLVRRERSLVMLTVGASMVVLGWFGLRALH
ncbi:MAG: hypothetical protein ACK5CE_16215 [Actinomycetes bacterium]|jgi:hypothetical protein|uniref:Unannotated protein n=1 Tax=freshwater metagenome TaxID=449393 RepID=A0A6J6F0L7_9ZZZZ|nr:hypothetical protein [Actinomycetota bacterium]